MKSLCLKLNDWNNIRKKKKKLLWRKETLLRRQQNTTTDLWNHAIQCRFGSNLSCLCFASSAFSFFLARICWLFHGEQCTRSLFTNPQIPLFSNFFIKNGSHSTTHTFKNYFAIVFSVFSFSKISFIQTDPQSNHITTSLSLYIYFH